MRCTTHVHGVKSVPNIAPNAAHENELNATVACEVSHPNVALCARGFRFTTSNLYLVLLSCVSHIYSVN
ncbi:MAG: hypothetical protein AAF512_14705, partial [Pseudomonadota bacterium]